MSTPLPILDTETSTLFNPAFCAVLLHRATKEYTSKAGQLMPVTFAFLVLPSALHKPTRDVLPASTATSMWSWLRAHPTILMDLCDRVRGLQPFTANAIVHGLQHGVLLSELGTLGAGTLRRRPKSLRPTSDWLDCVQAAEFLGRWFGGTGADEPTVLAQWGVRP